VLIAQLSDVHVGGGRYREELLRMAIEEINAAEPDVVVVAGDLTDEGYPDQYPLAKEELSALSCPQVVRVPGNHDARNVGYLGFEDTFGARDSRLRLELDRLQLALETTDSHRLTMNFGDVETRARLAQAIEVEEQIALALELEVDSIVGEDARANPLLILAREKYNRAQLVGGLNQSKTYLGQATASEC
jgi:predicted MPP superfamily phosphohydrolase